MGGFHGIVTPDPASELKKRMRMKIHAFDEQGRATPASQAVESCTYYDASGLCMHRKTLPKQNKKDPKNWYYAYNNLAERTGKPSPGMTHTHSRMQAIIFGLGYIKCDLAGVTFWAMLSNVDIEHRIAPNQETLQGYRRCDVWSASISKSSDAGAVGKPLGIEIGVTSLVQSERRRIDLEKDGALILEILPDRDVALEECLADLDRRLTALLLDGGIPGRWIRSPEGVEAEAVSIAEMRKRLDAEKRILDSDIARLRVDLTNAENLRDTKSEDEAANYTKRRDELERKQMHAIAKGRQIVEQRHKRDGNLAWLSLIDDVIVPMLAESPAWGKKYKKIASEIRKRVSPGKSGIIGWLREADETRRAITQHERYAQNENEKRVSMLKQQLNDLSSDSSAVDSAFKRLNYIEERGVRELWHPRNWKPSLAIAYEYRGAEQHPQG